MSKTIYTHKHHIIPRHAGGSNDPSNLIELTVEEHALAHKKLFFIYGRWQDEIAWLTLSGQIGKEEATRRAISATHKGKTIPLEMRQRISAKLKGRKMSPERIAKQTGINNCNYGKKLGPRSEATKEKIRQARKKQVIVHSDETKRKIGDAHRGSKRTEETKKKMSEAAKGRIPWNKGKKGVQVAWNKGLKKSSTSLT